MYTTEADEWEKHESWDLPAGETASSILRCAANQRQPEVSAQVGFIDLTGGGNQQETSLKSNSLSHDWHFYRATIQSFHTVWMSVWIKSFNFCFSWALAIQKRSFWPVRDSELHVIATAWLSNAGFFFPEWQLMRSSPVLLQSKVWHCAPWYQVRDEPAITVQVMKKAFMQHNRLL